MNDNEIANIPANDYKNFNMSMLTDFYELTMANGYLESGLQDTVAYFDLYFRTVPDEGGFAIMAGLESAISYISNLKFSDSDIEYIKEKKFSSAFIEYIKNFKFSCDIWAIPEGTPIFPTEPVIKVRGPVIQAQLVETTLLLLINHQSLIATKASRIVRAAKGRAVLEFGARRSHGVQAAVEGARAAYIGGCAGSSCTISDIIYGVPALGTMAHSWIQLFPTELDAFKAYARTYPDNCVLLVDTYNTLKSGVKNAIKAFNEEVLPRGFRPKGIRIDSGDITYLARKARKMLDDAGFPDCQICISNSLDEYLIAEMIAQGSPVDSFGVGERLITASSCPVFGGVYKLCAIETDGVVTPKVKISDNVSKITIPGDKKVWRLFDRETGKAIADVLTCHDEVIDENQPYEIFDPEHIWKRKLCTDFYARELLVQIFKDGKLIYRCPSISEVRTHCQNQLETLWDEVKRFNNPHTYYVDLSQKLWDLRNELLSKAAKLQHEK
ncbi:MAG: nicotinate phosphoribosyltransferase [Oscillospiraceae bacterium]|jgi:nicotinate phosphoribosyltransferase|nr:nicotinate phosphoribosyltransferase [Oscillospiraceae bacterium]